MNIIKKVIKPTAVFFLFIAMAIAFPLTAAVFGSTILPALAFFHVSPALALGLYALLLLSWSLIYSSPDWHKSEDKQQKAPLTFKALGILSMLLHGFILMSAAIAFGFLPGGLVLTSGIFFIAGLMSAYALTYQRICEVGVEVSEKRIFNSNNWYSSKLAFIIALLVGISSAVFIYYMPLVLLSSIVVVPLHLVLVKAAVAFVAFVSTFSICFVPLKEQLDNLFTMKRKDITFSKVVLFIASLIATVVFCLVAYHQAALLFTITNGNRGFLIAEICFQGLAFAAMCFDSYKVLTPIFRMVFNNIIMIIVNVCFLLPLLLVTIVAKYILPILGLGESGLDRDRRIPASHQKGHDEEVKKESTDKPSKPVLGLGKSGLDRVRRFLHSKIIPASHQEGHDEDSDAPDNSNNPSKLVFVLGGMGRNAKGKKGVENSYNNNGDTNDCNAYYLSHLGTKNVSIDKLVDLYVDKLAEKLLEGNKVTSIKLVGHCMGGAIFTLALEKMLSDKRFKDITDFELCADRTFASLSDAANNFKGYSFDFMGYSLVSPILTLLGWNLRPSESIENILENYKNDSRRNISIYINSAKEDGWIGSGALQYDAYSSRGNVKIYGKQFSEGTPYKQHIKIDKLIGVFEDHEGFTLRQEEKQTQEQNSSQVGAAGLPVTSGSISPENKPVLAGDLIGKSKGNGGVLGFISQCLGISSSYQQVL